jgi:transposase InsO family protein
LALIDLSVVEQRYRAVLAVQAGARIGEVARSVGVSRQTLHGWVSRYRESGLAGLADRSRRPVSSPNQAAPEVEAAVCELRRHHPRWGPQRIFAVLARNGCCPGPVPARMTVYRILVRHGLIDPAGRKRRRPYRRWQRELPMQLWQLDIVGGILLAHPSGGPPVEVKIATGVDDRSRFAVIATVMPRATGRQVCLAFAAALREYGIPEEVLTDIQRQTIHCAVRAGRGGAVRSDLASPTG